MRRQELVSWTWVKWRRIQVSIAVSLLPLSALLQQSLCSCWLHCQLNHTAELCSFHLRQLTEVNSLQKRFHDVLEVSTGTLSACVCTWHLDAGDHDLLFEKECVKKRKQEVSHGRDTDGVQLAPFVRRAGVFSGAVKKQCLCVSDSS